MPLIHYLLDSSFFSYVVKLGSGDAKVLGVSLDDFLEDQGLLWHDLRFKQAPGFRIGRQLAQARGK